MAYQPHCAQALPQSTFAVHQQASAMHQALGTGLSRTQAHRLRPSSGPGHRPLPTLPLQPTRKLPTHLCHTQFVPARRIYRSLHKKHLIALQFLRLSLLSPTDTPPGSLQAVYNQLSPTLFSRAVTETILLYPTLPHHSQEDLLTTTSTLCLVDFLNKSLPGLNKNGCPRRSVPQVRCHRRRRRARPLQVCPGARVRHPRHQRHLQLYCRRCPRGCP